MKNLIKFFGNLNRARSAKVPLLIIALAAVIGFSFASCQNGTTSGGPVPIIAVTGPPTITTTALLPGTVGTAYNQTLVATGDTPITWSLDSGTLPAGLILLGSGAISGTPTTAATSTFTVKATNAAGNNTKQLSITIAAGSTTPTYSLDGVWENSVGGRITVSGSTGVRNAFWSPLSALAQDAINKGYYSLGEQCWRNITSTGNLTWSGQAKGVTYNTSNPNVATGVAWNNITFTMSADGQTLTEVTSSSSGTSTVIYTRKQ